MKIHNQIRLLMAKVPLYFLNYLHPYLMKHHEIQHRLDQYLNMIHIDNLYIVQDTCKYNL